jgi:putative oxidoreductase
MPTTLWGRAALALSWILQLYLAYTFARSGFAKMVGDPIMVRIFNFIGFGQWFRYVSGVVELTGFVLILLPRWSVLGGLWLAATMFVAILINVFVTHTNPVAPIELFLVAIVVVVLRWNQLMSLISRIQLFTFSKPQTLP